VNLTIRKAKTSESKLLTKLALESKAYWGYSDEFMQNCREELTVNHAKLSNQIFQYQVAEFNKSVIGFYALENIAKYQVELEALFVDPKYIGKGVGKALINHAKSSAVKFGVKSMIIHSDPNAKEFYIAAGAKQVGEKMSGSITGRFLPTFKILL